MKGMKFSTIGSRNRNNQGSHNYHSGSGAQLKPKHYGTGEHPPQAQSSSHEIRGYLHKAMNLHVKSAFYEALEKNEMYPLDSGTTSFHQLATKPETDHNYGELYRQSSL